MKVISQYISTKFNAGPKAKIDVEKILKKKYNAKICTFNLNEVDGRIISKIKKFLFSFFNLMGNDLTIIQFPFTNKKKLLKLAKNKVAFIHDIDGIRYKDEKVLFEEIEGLNSFKYVIVHNKKMEAFLKENGLKAKTIVLELFDYLTDYIPNANKEIDVNNIRIAYPGNLEKAKANFLYQLEEDKMNFTVVTYGANFEENANKKVIFDGKHSPDVLPEKLRADLGLVWSGSIDDSDVDIGEKDYNRYNTPHKLSCYIVAGLPVIVWKESAVADIVNKYNIGYTISNLYDINLLDLSQYEGKRKNVLNLSTKLRNGEFTLNAINEIIK